MSPTKIITAIPPISRGKQLLFRNDMEQRELEIHCANASTLKAAQTNVKSFLTFNNASSVTEIKKEYLTDEICAAYISAVRSSVPFVGPATVRGNISHIFHTSFLNVSMKPMKKQLEKTCWTVDEIVEDE